MKLLDAAQQLGYLDSDSTIYAREPWTGMSEVKIVFEGSDEDDAAH